MRVIKFRGWNKRGGKMVDLGKLTPLVLNGDCGSLEGIFLPFHEDIELMQFTGSVDRKGREIYE